jgi:hypothetical protein
MQPRGERNRFAPCDKPLFADVMGLVLVEVAANAAQEEKMPKPVIVYW